MEHARIQAIGTAIPEYSISQQEVKEFVARLFGHSYKDINRLLTIFDHKHIHKRYLAMPMEWYDKEHSFAETNLIYQQVGLRLAEQASRAAIQSSGIDPLEIGMIIVVSSTGIVTPTLDSMLIQTLGLAVHTKRIPIWGLGCAGGVAGLARAAELAKTMTGKSVLLITLELCSLTFQRNDFSKANLVGTSLFADGAAAVIISTAGDGPEIINSYSHLFPKSADVMGWDIVETGLKVRFSKSIPQIILKFLPKVMENSCANWNIDQSKIEYYIVHPGGGKVIEAYQESLNLSEDILQYATQILYGYGNMSSVSVLFEMKEFISHSIRKGKYGIMLALGPGFSAEQVLFLW